MISLGRLNFRRDSIPFVDVQPHFASIKTAEHARITIMSVARQKLLCPSNRLFDMRTGEHHKPNASRNTIPLAEINESWANSHLPSQIQQQLP